MCDDEFLIVLHRSLKSFCNHWTGWGIKDNNRVGLHDILFHFEVNSVGR